MKLCATLLKVVLVVVLVEAVLCDKEGGDPSSKTVAGGESSGAAERVCPLEAGKVESGNVFTRVMRLSLSCVEELFVKKIVKNENTTTEELRHYFEGACQKKARFQECLSEKASNLEACPDATVLTEFKIMREVLERKIESGCAQNAERLVQFFSFTTQPDKKQMGKCMINFEVVANELNTEKVDLSSKLFIAHKLIITFKECFRSIELDPQVRKQLDYFIDETITTMQCVHPNDGTLVTCASIDAALINFKNICDFKTQHNTLSPYEVFEDDAFRWFDEIIEQDKLDADQEDITTDNEKLREDFKQFCEHDAMFLGNKYLDEIKLLSQLCLNDTVKKEFDLLVDTIIGSWGRGCVEDGKRLADIMFEVYRLKRTSPDHGHAVWECIDVAKATRNEINEHRISTKNMRFYHELETFKECFLNKVHNDQTSVVAATSLINEMLENVKCVNPEDGTTVLCTSLMHSHVH